MQAPRPLTEQATPVSPTFNQDIAGILYEHCVTCHRPGEVAPMSLQMFEEARPWAARIKAEVTAGRMPPWFADRRFGSFSNEPRITPSERAALVAWADGGAPEGLGEPPPLPRFRDGWNSALNRPPDRVIEAPIDDIEVPATGEVRTFTVWTKLPFRFERYVEALELRPTNRAVVHHASVSLGPVPPGTRFGKAVLWPGGPSLDHVRLDTEGKPFQAAMTSDFGYPVLFYVPGGGILRFPRGVAKRFRPDEYIAWGLHLVSTGRPEKIGLRLGLWFAKTPPTHEVLTLTVNAQEIVDGRVLPVAANGVSKKPVIPAGARAWVITGLLPFDQDARLYALWPHMHYRGKSMVFVLQYPDGRERILLNVPRYDFRWQATYSLVDPLEIPAGSVIRATAYYDNSSDNPSNPDPTQDVTWGEQSWNEMFYPFVEVSFDDDDLRFERLLR
jgi:hypothetical protein